MTSRIRRFLLLILLLPVPQPHASGQQLEIIGYFPSWKWRTDTNLMTPEKIPFGELTIINYAFFYPRPDGTIVGRDTIGDGINLRGTYIGPDSSGRAGPGLTALAHRHGVRVLLSIGGWEDSGNFPAVAASATSRARFAHSCLERIIEFGFDGIDIDWEFPGYVEHNGTPEDRENFTLLLRSLRDSLDASAAASGKALLLTAALPAGAAQAAGMEIGKIAGILDFMNIMTYDFFGTWDERAHHNAPLYPSEGADPARSVDGAFRLYTQTYGIPASRITLGIPVYGRAYAGCGGLNDPHTGSDTVHFPAQGAFYYAIAAQAANFARYRDERAKVPYLVSRTWNTFVSYDDEESVREKAAYALAAGVRGVILWEITGDFMPDGSHPLLSAVAATLRQAGLQRK